MKNTIRYILHLSVAFGLLFSACKKESRGDCFKGTGETASEARILPPFTKIFLKGNMNVILTQGSTQEVKITGGKNLLSLINTEVVDGELRLNNYNRCNWARSYKKGNIDIYITLPVIRKISHLGSGFIKSTDTLVCDTLTILTKESGDADITVKANQVFTQLHGTSDITLHGITGLHGNFHLGEGYLHAEDMQSNYTWTDSQASGNEYFNARDNLWVTIEWAGDVYYSGNPVILQQGNGRGKLIHQN